MGWENRFGKTKDKDRQFMIMRMKGSHFYGQFTLEMYFKISSIAQIYFAKIVTSNTSRKIFSLV